MDKKEEEAIPYVSIDSSTGMAEKYFELHSFTSIISFITFNRIFTTCFEETYLSMNFLQDENNYCHFGGFFEIDKSPLCDMKQFFS